MAESTKQAPSSVDSKVKKSSFDFDFGNDFLGSWNAEDDAMDFGFDIVSTGKKKPFKFGKLDMDFSLDGDFDKLTSFKMDMPDLDFSSPSKKTAKPKDSSKGESSDGAHQEKRERFSSSFNYNELDFDFDSTLTEGKKVSAKNSDKKDDGSVRIEQQGSKLNLVGSNETFDVCRTDNVPASDIATASTVETTASGAPGASDASNDSKVENIGGLVSTHESQTSPHKTFFLSVNPNDADQQICLVEKAKSTEPIALITTQIIPALSVNREDSTQATESDSEADASTLKVYKESVEHNVINTKVDHLGSDHDNSRLKNPVPSQKNESRSTSFESEKADGETQAKNVNGTAQVQDDLDGEVTSAATRSQSDCIEDIHKPASIPLAPLRSEHVVDIVIPIEGSEPEISISKIFPSSNVTEPQLRQPSSVDVQAFSAVNKGLVCSYPAKEKREGSCVNKPEVGSSEILQSSIETEPQLCQPSSVGGKVFSAGNKGLANSYPASEKREGICVNKPKVCSSKTSIETEPQLCQPSSVGVQVSPAVNEGLTTSYPGNGKKDGVRLNEAETQRKLTGEQTSLTIKLTKGETDFSGSKRNDKDLSNISTEGSNGDKIKNVSKLGTPLKRPNKEATKADSILLGGGINNKDLHNFGGNANSARTDEATKSNTQKNVDSTTVVSSMISTRNLKIGSSEGLKSGRRTTDLSSLEISRNTELTKDHSDAMPRRDLSSFRNSEKDTEVQGSNTSKIFHPVEIKTSPVTSLKRKTYEASNSNQVLLHPQKRLSQSPIQSRNLKEPLERKVEVQCNQPEKNTNTVVYDQPTPGLEMQNEKEHSIFLTMESDQNVEKAEEYATELEDMCNMLKKKHEEAKELLVRAIVNNNQLLMLNHPMFDAKIQRVKKFAAQLVSSCS